MTAGRPWEPLARCACCGTALLTGQARTHVGKLAYCAPAGSSCHVIGEKSAGWRLTEHEAAAILAADVVELRRLGVRSVDPHHDPAGFQGAQHVAA